MFPIYPYLNINDLNLDYILKQIGILKTEVTQFVSLNAIKYADPIQWNITNQYEKNTVVIDPLTGTAYISVAPAPNGVALTNTDYWTVVFDLGSFVTRAAQNFTSRWESETTNTATFATAMGEWLVWGDVLYKALTNITAGDQYVVNSNIQHFTIEDLYNAYLNTIASILAMIGDLGDLNTTDKSDVVNAINEVYGLADTNKTNIGTLSSLKTNNKSDIVSAINEISDKLVTPENYRVADTDTDTMLIQAAVDALALTGGTIALDRIYTLDGNIYISHNSDTDENQIRFIGVSAGAGINFDDYSFMGQDVNYRIYGGLRFINCELYGNEKGFITNNLIRLFFDSCTIHSFKYFLYGDVENSSQSIFINGCYIRRVSESVMYSHHKAWDTHISNSLIERCTNLVDIDTVKVLFITNNLIENVADENRADNCKIRIIGEYRDVVISDNYFEDNFSEIDMSGCTNFTTDRCTVMNNSIWNNRHSTTSILLPKSVSQARFLIINNAYSSPYNDGYAIAISETGHYLYGVMLLGNGGTNYLIYDPNYQLYELMKDSPQAAYTAGVNLTYENVNPRFYVNGKVCRLSISAQLGEAVPSATAIFQITDPYLYPEKNAICQLGVVSGGVVTNYMAAVSDTGRVYCFSSLSSGDHIIIDFEWIAR